MQTKRNCGLDVLRIGLCFSVVIFHYMGSVSCAGGVAVCGFFVLSGFCAAIAAHGEPVHVRELGNYYWKKACRILPLLMLLWLIANMEALLSGNTWIRPAPWNLLHDPAMEIIRLTNSWPAWYMASVIVFILIFPVLMIFYGKPAMKWVLLLFFLLALWRSLKYPFICPGVGKAYSEVSGRLWQIILGMWCSGWNVASWKLAYRRFWIIFGLLWLTGSHIISCESIGKINFTFPAYSISCVIFALHIACIWNTPPMSVSSPFRKLIQLFSGMSYALFLFHRPVETYLHRLWKLLHDVFGLSSAYTETLSNSIFVPLTASIFVSFIVYRYIEMYIYKNAFKKHKLLSER